MRMFLIVAKYLIPKVSWVNNLPICSGEIWEDLNDSIFINHEKFIRQQVEL
jgi:hypothetical protein